MLRTTQMSEAHVRVAALGDIHVNETNRSEVRDLLIGIGRTADLLVLCGDLTNRGLPTEAAILAEDLVHCPLPVVAVLGNHDVESGQEHEVVKILREGGVTMLDDEPYETQGIGFAGVKGFCGGFDQHELTPFGEASIKAFVRESLDEALRLESSLARLRTIHKIAVLHYAPVRDTVEGEPPEIFPFLGSSRLADPIDRFNAMVGVHGHAHNGTHAGKTNKGIPIYNVALAIMKRESPEQPYLLLSV